jgi:hypothetical protein
MDPINQRSRKVIDDAITLLQTKGWIQGRLAKDARGEGTWVMNEDATCFCAAGAICRAAGDSPIGQALWDKLDDWVNQQIDPNFRYSGIAGFNDSPGRTREEVIAFLTRFRDEELAEEGVAT